MLKTRPTTLAVQTGATARMVDGFHRGGVNLKRWFGGSRERSERHTTEMTSWRRRKVRGREDVLRTHLLLR
jgi:hypothetical protein